MELELSRYLRRCVIFSMETSSEDDGVCGRVLGILNWGRLLRGELLAILFLASFSRAYGRSFAGIAFFAKFQA